MAEGANVLDAAWKKVRWWWVGAGWLWFIAAWSAVVAARAQVLAHHVGLPRATWGVLLWLVVTVAYIVVAAGTLRVARLLVKQRLEAAGLAVLLVVCQTLVAVRVFLYIAVYVHLWAGGSL